MEITTKIYAVTVQINNGDDIIAKEILCDKQGGQLPHELAPYIPTVGERFGRGKIVHVSTPFLVRTVVDRIPESAFISEGTDERTKTTELYVYINSTLGWHYYNVTKDGDGYCAVVGEQLPVK